jgi:hypothetical protein
MNTEIKFHVLVLEITLHCKVTLGVVSPMLQSFVTLFRVNSLRNFMTNPLVSLAVFPCLACIEWQIVGY